MFDVWNISVVFVVSDGGDGDLEDEDQQSWVSPVIEQRLSELANSPDQFQPQLQLIRDLSKMFTLIGVLIKKNSIEAEYKSCAMNENSSEFSVKWELAGIWSSWRMMEYLYIK